jgi:hypothetical protein
MYWPKLACWCLPPLGPQAQRFSTPVSASVTLAIKSKQITLFDLPIWFNNDMVNALVVIMAELYLFIDNGLVKRGSDVKKVLVKKFGMPFNTWKEIIEKYRIK